MQSNATSLAHGNDGCLTAISGLLEETPGIVLAVLVGSRASGRPHPESDWDIALVWQQPNQGALVQLREEEMLRQRLAACLDISSEKIDLIDLDHANLAMRANAAESGILLKGDNTLAWSRFLTRTWRELEDFYWDRAHAA